MKVVSLQESGPRRRAWKVSFDTGLEVTVSKAVARALDLKESSEIDFDTLVACHKDDFALTSELVHAAGIPDACQLVCADVPPGPAITTSDCAKMSDEVILRTLIDRLSSRLGRKRAFALVASRDYTVFEVQQRLKWDGYSDALVKELVAHLQELDLLNDERFTRNFCESRLLAGYGPYVIVRKLSAKGIEEDDAKEALSLLIEDEGFDLDERATHLIAKFDREDPRQKQRAMRKLIARGYDYDCIKRICS